MNIPLPIVTEKRREFRKSLRGPAWLRLPNEKTLEVITMNMNFGGMGIVSPSNLLARVECEIQVPMPVAATGKQLVEFEVRVAYSILSRDRGGFYIGLQFVNVSESEAAVIEQFMHYGQYADPFGDSVPFGY